MRAALLFCLALIAGCSLVSTPEEQAVDVANAYLAKHGYSRANSRRRVTVSDGGKLWAVTYHVSAGAAGGEMVVFVDKQSHQAVRHYMEQ